MPSVTFEHETGAELATLRQAAAFVAEMGQLAQAAPGGHVLELCEARALDQGRQLRRDALQAAARGRARPRRAYAICPAREHRLFPPDTRLGLGSWLTRRALEVAGARWRRKHVGPLAGLLALADGPGWREHWASLAA